MRLRYTVSVDIDPDHREMKEWQAAGPTPISPSAVVRSEILSALGSVGYVTDCQVSPITHRARAESHAHRHRPTGQRR